MEQSPDPLSNATSIHISATFPDFNKTNSQSLFVREQIDHVRQYVKEVHVIVPTLLFPKQDGHEYKKDYDYENVHVKFPKYVYPPRRLFIKPINFRVRILKWILQRNISRAKAENSLIHAHFGTTANLLVDMKGQMNLPMVVSFYGYDAYQKNFTADYYRPLTEASDRVLALSQHMKDRLVALGFPKQKVMVHHLGVDTEFFKPPETKRENSPLKLTTLAHFVEKKGILDAIDAFYLARKQFPDIRFDILGFGPLQDQIEHKIRELGLEGVVHVIDNRKFQNPRIDIKNRLQQSDMFILPSKTASSGDSEGTPVVLMEASACGLPCITTQHSGNPEIVIDRKTGLVVPEGDVQSLAEAIVNLARDEKLRIQYGSAARKHVLDEFNLVTQGFRLAEIYRDLLVRD